MRKLLSIPFCLLYVAVCVTLGPLWIASNIFEPKRPTLDVKTSLDLRALPDPFRRGFRHWLWRLWNGWERKCQLLEDYVFLINGRRYRVRCTFISDGNSNPRFLWRLFGTPWTGPQRWAAVPHDAAYAGVLEVYDVFEGCWVWADLTRRESDELYREIIKAKHASRFCYRGSYRGLRIFGGGRFTTDIRLRQEARLAVMG